MSASKSKDPSKNPLKYFSVCSWLDPEDTRKVTDELCDLKGFLKLVQNKKVKGPAVVTYSLTMKSTVKGRSSCVELPCSSVPESVRALKEEIEEAHSVPVGLQTLSYQGETLGDSDTRLRRVGARIKDPIEVSYTCEAEVQKVKRVLAWVDYLLTYLHQQHPLLSTELSQEAELIATMGLNERLFQRMATNYFSPPESARVQANKAYFLAKDGVRKLVNLLNVVTDCPWSQEVLHLKLLEAPILDALRAFATGNEAYVKELVRHDVPGFVVMMLTRVRLVPFRPVEDLMGTAGVKAHNDILVLDMIGAIIEIMWTMRRHKEQFTEMTTYHICTENLVFLSVSPSVTNRQACLAVYLVLLRLCWVESKVDLGQASLIFLDSPRMRESFGESPEEVIAIKYFCTVFVAWKLLHNCIHFKTPGAGIPTQIHNTYNFMKDFLATCPRDEIIKMVERYDLVVYNLLPMFGLLFRPKNQPRTLLPDYSLEFITELDTMAVRCLLVHLEVVLSQQSLRDELKFKDTDQHIVVFPWGLPSPIKEHAQHLTRFVHSFKPLPVPKLSIIVRAKLARTYLEFDKLQKEKEGEGSLDQVAYPQIARVGMPVMTHRCLPLGPPLPHQGARAAPDEVRPQLQAAPRPQTVHHRPSQAGAHLPRV
jgi:hypothetical protein